MIPDSTITKVEVFNFTIPFARPYKISLGWIDTAKNILIRIHTADGLYGLGEGSPISYISGETQETCFTVAKAFANLLLQKDATTIEARLKEMDAFIAHHQTVKSAFDIALYDLLGKKAGLPIYTLLGGEKRTIVTDWTIGIGTPEEMAGTAVEIKSAGFSAIKLKLGTSHDEDVARIQAVRNAIGPELPIRIDANQGWSPEEAIRILSDIAPCFIQYCEQPVAAWNIIGLKRVMESSPIPIVADESIFTPWDAFQLLRSSACNYLNIKLAKAGGIHRSLMINAIAESAGINCMLGSMNESRLALTAAAHLASARRNITFTDLDTHLFHATDPVQDGIKYEKGTITLPDLPGLGADILPDEMEKMELVYSVS